MGKRTGKHHYLIGQDNRGASELDLDTRLELLLEEKMHGISFPKRHPCLASRLHYHAHGKTNEETHGQTDRETPLFNWAR
jgi:hypothetical protein